LDEHHRPATVAFIRRVSGNGWCADQDAGGDADCGRQ
jgi:hypothetical protein